MRKAAAVLALVWVICLPVAALAQRLSIETSAQGETVTVAAAAEMQVAPLTAWSVISDYGHLAEFIPGMQSSRVLERDGNALLIEQTGSFSFLFFQQRVEVQLAVVEYPPQRIVAHAVAGNFKTMEGRYELESLPSGEVRLSYSGRLVPDFALPPLIGKMLMRQVLAKQFTAMVNEILRRDALAQGAR